MEKLYIAVKTGQLSLEDFNKLIDEIWTDGYDCHEDKQTMRELSRDGGWDKTTSINKILLEYLPNSY